MKTTRKEKKKHAQGGNDGVIRILYAVQVDLTKAGSKNPLYKSKSAVNV